MILKEVKRYITALGLKYNRDMKVSDKLSKQGNVIIKLGIC